jgi:hypothetical protein
MQENQTIILAIFHHPLSHVDGFGFSSDNDAWVFIDTSLDDPAAWTPHQV